MSQHAFKAVSLAPSEEPYVQGDGYPHKKSGNALESYTTSSIDNSRTATASEADEVECEAAGSPECAVIVRSRDLQFHECETAHGRLRVSNAISMNDSYTGLLEVPPRTRSGAQRAMKGDEIFFVRRGAAFVDIGNKRFAVQEGDHFAIPHRTSYSLINSSFFTCTLVFFVPRNPFG